MSSNVTLDTLAGQFIAFTEEVRGRFDQIGTQLEGLAARVTTLEGAIQPQTKKVDTLFDPNSEVFEEVFDEIVAPVSDEEIIDEQDPLNGYVSNYLGPILGTLQQADFLGAIGAFDSVVSLIAEDRGNGVLSDKNLETYQDCHQKLQMMMNGQVYNEEEQALIDGFVAKGMNYILKHSQEDEMEEVVQRMTQILQPWISISFEGKDPARVATVYLEETKAREALEVAKEAMSRLDYMAVLGELGILELANIENKAIHKECQKMSSSAETARVNTEKALPLVAESYDFLEAGQFNRAAQKAAEAEALQVEDPAVLASITDIKTQAEAQIQMQAGEAEERRRAYAALNQFEAEINGWQNLAGVPQELEDLAVNGMPGVKERAEALSKRLITNLRTEEYGWKAISNTRERVANGSYQEAINCLASVNSGSPALLKEVDEWRVHTERRLEAMNCLNSADKALLSGDFRKARELIQQSMSSNHSPIAEKKRELMRRMAAFEQADEAARELLIKAEDKIREQNGSEASTLLRQVEEMVNNGLKGPVERLLANAEGRLQALQNRENSPIKTGAAPVAASTSSLEERVVVEATASPVAAVAAATLPPSPAPQVQQPVSHYASSAAPVVEEIAASAATTVEVQEEVQAGGAAMDEHEFFMKSQEIIRMLPMSFKRGRAETEIRALLGMSLPGEQGQKVEKLRVDYNAKYPMNAI